MEVKIVAFYDGHRAGRIIVNNSHEMRKQRFRQWCRLQFGARGVGGHDHDCHHHHHRPYCDLGSSHPWAVLVTT